MPVSDVAILLVEDNPDDVELALHALCRDLAHHIEVARDGEEALDFLFCRGNWAHRQLHPPPRLVLLDIKLPKLDGLEVLRQLKSDTRTRMIPVVMLTASREESDLLQGYQYGANSYIQKPVDFEQFREIVHHLGMYWLVVNQPPPCEEMSEHA